MTTRALTEQIKVGLAIGAMLAVVLGFILARLKVRAQQNDAARQYLKNTPMFKLGGLSFNAGHTFCIGLLVFAVFGAIN